MPLPTFVFVYSKACTDSNVMVSFLGLGANDESVDHSHSLRRTWLPFETCTPRTALTWAAVSREQGSLGVAPEAAREPQTLSAVMMQIVKEMEYLEFI